MKNAILYLLLFYIFCGCNETNEMGRPTILYLSGQITNKQTFTPIDSVAVTLEFSSLTGMYYNPETTFYSGNNGKFNFQFSPKQNTSYNLTFFKQEYRSPSLPTSIDRDREYQSFTIVLDTL
ncbi:hypothetical protein BH11BAC1_BH11BAC1_22800 [soil metagenome]